MFFFYKVQIWHDWICWRTTQKLSHKLQEISCWCDHIEQLSKHSCLTTHIRLWIGFVLRRCLIQSKHCNTVDVRCNMLASRIPNSCFIRVRNVQVTCLKHQKQGFTKRTEALKKCMSNWNCVIVCSLLFMASKSAVYSIITYLWYTLEESIKEFCEGIH